MFKNLVAHAFTKNFDIAASNALNIPLPMPFQNGYSNQVICRISNLAKMEDGTVFCRLNNVEGAIAARIASPHFRTAFYKEWDLASVNLITVAHDGGYNADILKIQRIPISSENLLDVMPLSLCRDQHRLSQFRNLVQLIQSSQLRAVVVSVYGHPSVFRPFLTKFGGKEIYKYAGGLLARTVDSGTYAARMGFDTQEEADFVLAAALLCNLGRIKDMQPTPDNSQAALVFAPHPQTFDIVNTYASVGNDQSDTLKEFLTARDPGQTSLSCLTLKMHKALAAIKTQIRFQHVSFATECK